MLIPPPKPTKAKAMPPSGRSWPSSGEGGEICRGTLMRIMRLLLPGLLATLLLSGGCTLGSSKAVVTADPVGSADQFVMSKLEQSAGQIQQDLNNLARLYERDAIVEGNVTPTRPPKDSVLFTKLPMRWNGPLEPALKTVAKSIGWDFRVSGSKPVQNIIVQIDSRDMPVYEIVAHCGHQAGKQAAVIISEEMKTIEVIYTPNVGA